MPKPQLELYMTKCIQTTEAKAQIVLKPGLRLLCFPDGLHHRLVIQLDGSTEFCAEAAFFA